MLTNIDIKKGVFQFYLEVNRYESYWVCNPKNYKVSLDMDTMHKKKLPFDLPVLIAFHHRLTLKTFTTISLRKIAGPYAFLLKLSQVGAITQRDIKDILFKLNLQKEANEEVANG